MLVWFDFIFLGDLNKCFPHFISCCFFSLPSRVPGSSVTYVFCFFLTLFKEELANLQHNRQSGAMFQDEKRSLFINLRGSRFPARSIPIHPGQAGLLGCFQITANNLFLCKAENEDLCLVVELDILQYKRTEQPANST